MLYILKHKIWVYAGNYLGREFTYGKKNLMITELIWNDDDEELGTDEIGLIQHCCKR